MQFDTTRFPTLGVSAHEFGAGTTRSGELLPTCKPHALRELQLFRIVFDTKCRKPIASRTPTAVPSEVNLRQPLSFKGFGLVEFPVRTVQVDTTQRTIRLTSNLSENVPTVSRFC